MFRFSLGLPAALAALTLGLAAGSSIGAESTNVRGRRPAASCPEQVALKSLGDLTWKHFAPIGNAFAEAGKEFPTDPISRGIYLRQKVGEQAIGFVVTPRTMIRNWTRSRRSVEIPPTLRVTRHGRIKKGLAVLPVPELNTVLYASRKDVHHTPHYWNCEGCSEPVQYRPLKLRSGIKAIFSAKHGWTGPYSMSMRMEGVMAVGNGSWRYEEYDEGVLVAGKNGIWRYEEGIDGGENRVVRELVKEGLFFPSSVLAMDQPFHGAGPVAHRYNDLHKLIEYEMSADSYLARYGLPLIEFSRSGATMSAGQRNFEYSFPNEYSVRGVAKNPLRAMVWIGPVHPVHGLAKSCNELEAYTLKCIREKGAQNSAIRWNPLSFGWFRTLAEQMLEVSNPWWESTMPLGKEKTPLLILVGEHDEQTSQEVRKWYREFAANYPEYVEYHEIKGAGHDVLATTEKYTGEKNSVSEENSARARATGVWRIIYRFLRKHVPEVI